MRLREIEKNAIIQSVLSFDPDAEIFLFGSRTDDRKKGGDIDILIISDTLHEDMLHLLQDELFRHIEEQKIDFVFTGKSRSSRFADMILSKGAIRLCPMKR